jgi:hemerythrin-like domain-containing protein
MNEMGLPETLPGFDQPLALLKACHTKILAHCDLLEELLANLADAGRDEDVRSAARRAVTYFSTGARLHHQDEETDLFPLLIRQSLKLADRVRAFCELNRQHVKRENMEFLPRAEGILSSRQLKDIGTAMAARRGVRYTG